MLKRRTSHRDMADVNIYTAKKLNEMAMSLSVLARACDDQKNEEKNLSREDGLAAMQAASMMVCGECRRCGIYEDSEAENSYYLYYLLRSFEQKGNVDEEDMPQRFRERCRQKDAYLGLLNRSLGKATMNLDWKNRFLESRDAVMVQFRELAVILEEFSHQMEQASDITFLKEGALRRMFRQNHLVVENMLMLQYENQQREAYITLRTNNGRCMTAKDVAELITMALGERDWMVARDSKSIVTRQAATFRFAEAPVYYMIHGVARAAKAGEPVSGDSYTFGETMPGQVLMSLSDGMGSGQVAAAESSRVIELTEQLLETGFSARAVLKLVNTILLLNGQEQHPATLDLCCIDLHTGVLEAMKSGAVATFILGENGVEYLESGNVPMGVVHSIEPVLLSKKVWDGSWIIMVSDGVLDALPAVEKEVMMQEYLETLAPATPQEMAEEILNFARSFGQEPKDDMTVLAAGIWKRK